jgi:hypothetical protein
MIQKTIDIACDGEGCHSFHEGTVPNKAKVLKEVRQLGWRRVINVKTKVHEDFCPSCNEKRKDKRKRMKGDPCVDCGQVAQSVCESCTLKGK